MSDIEPRSRGSNRGIMSKAYIHWCSQQSGIMVCHVIVKGMLLYSALATVVINMLEMGLGKLAKRRSRTIPGPPRLAPCQEKYGMCFGGLGSVVF